MTKWRWRIGARLQRTTIGIALLALIVAATISGAQRRQRDAMMQADPERILTDPALAQAALKIGATVFASHCASCHGPAGQGSSAVGAPDLTDGDWLYGSGQVAEIEQIVRHGIRSGDSKGWNLADMPAYGTPRPYAHEPIPPLRPGDINDVVNYLTSLRGTNHDPASAQRGQAIFAGGGACFDCHSPDARGDTSIGAPNLVDDIWLYGDGSPASLYRSIAYGHAGIMPAFVRTLSPTEARAVAVYAAAFAAGPPKDIK